MNPENLENVKRCWLAQWAHVGCGGAPVAYVGPGFNQLGCTGCSARWPGSGPLGEAVKRSKAFKTLIVRG